MNKLPITAICAMALSSFLLTRAMLCSAAPFVPAPALKVIAIEIGGKSADSYGPVDLRVLPQRAPKPVRVVVGDVVTRGMEIKTPADTTVTLKSINDVTIRLEPNGSLYVDSVLDNGREVYFSHSSTVHVSMAKPLISLVFGSGFSMLNTTDADFSIVSTKADSQTKEARVKVVRGVLAMEEGVKFTEVERGISTFEEAVMLLNVGESGRILLNRGKRDAVSFETFGAVKTHLENQIITFSQKAGVWGKQLALKNAAKVALRLKKQDEHLVYYEQWMASRNEDWYAQWAALRAFAASCASADDLVCAIRHHTAALALAEKLYPDELEIGLLTTRTNLTALKTKLYGGNANSVAFSARSNIIQAKLGQNVEQMAKLLVKGAVSYPKDMQRWGLEGDGLLNIVIGSDGLPSEVKVLQSPHPSFEAAIVRSALTSIFAPTIVDGKPSSVSVTIPYNFRFNDQSNAEHNAPFSFPKKPKPGLPAELQYDTPPAIKLVAPVVYPRDLLLKGTTGNATVVAVMDKQGRIRSVDVTAATHPEFGDAAKAMIQAWEFSPALKNKVAIDTTFKIEQKFTRKEFDTGFNERTRELLYELESPKSDVVEMDKLDTRPKALFSPPPFDPIPLSHAEAEDVVIEFFIDPDGGVQLPRIVSAKNKERGWAAATALKRWIFESPKVSGKPVFVRRELALGFN